MALSEDQEKALEAWREAFEAGRFEEAREIMAGLQNDLPNIGETAELGDVAEDLADGNPDDELAEAIEELEPAAGIVAQEALDAGRPDLAAEVVECTLTTLADWAESGEELADVLEEVADEIGSETAQAAADEAADASGEAAAAVEETLEEAGVPAAIAEAEVDPANGTEIVDVVPDVAPEPSHWLLRGRRIRL